MGEARRKIDADAGGFPRPRDNRCPACGSRVIIEIAQQDMAHRYDFDIGCDWQGCSSCKAVWEAFPASYVRDPVCAEPCDNCAFRPNSPEQQDSETWRAMLEKLKPDPATGWFTERFFCHKGVPIDLTLGPGNFRFPQKSLTLEDGTETVVYDQARMRTCSGFLRMFWARNAKGAPNRDPVSA